MEVTSQATLAQIIMLVHLLLGDNARTFQEVVVTLIIFNEPWYYEYKKVVLISYLNYQTMIVFTTKNTKLMLFKVKRHDHLHSLDI